MGKFWSRKFWLVYLLSFLFGYCLVAAAKPSEPLDTPLGDCFQLRSEYTKLSPIEGARFHWPLKDMPIMLIVDMSGEDLLIPTMAAAAWWNKQLGMTAFTVEKEPSPLAAIFLERSPGVVPIGVIEVAQEQCLVEKPATECYPRTEWGGDAIGRMKQAPIFFPPFYRGSHPRTWWLMAHELGHVLGLRHKKKGEGVMWNKPDLTDKADAPRLSPEDRTCIRDWYARTSTAG